MSNGSKKQSAACGVSARGWGGTGQVLSLQSLFSCFCAAYNGLCLVVCIVWVGWMVCWGSDEAQAQNVNNLLKKRSEPSAEMQKELDRTSEYSETERRLLDQRSVLQAQEESRLGQRSDMSPSGLRLLDVRSVFSPADLNMLNKRSEPDAAQTTHVRRYSQPEPRLLKRDHVFHPAIMSELLKRSNMTDIEKAQMYRALDQAQFSPVVQRSSVGTDGFDQLVSKRSVPERDWLKLIQNHSVD